MLLIITAILVVQQIVLKGVQAAIKMETIKVTVKSIKLFIHEVDDMTFNDVNITINEELDGYKANDAGGFEQAKVNSFKLDRAAFTAQVCELNDDLGLYRSTRTAGFDQAVLGLLFTGATLGVLREHHVKDEEVLDYKGEKVIVKGDDGVEKSLTYQRDCYTTKIISLTLTKRATEMINKKLESIL